MIEAQNELSDDIDKLNFNANDIKIISNYDGNVYNNSLKIKINLPSLKLGAFL